MICFFFRNKSVSGKCTYNKDKKIYKKCNKKILTEIRKKINHIKKNQEVKLMKILDCEWWWKATVGEQFKKKWVKIKMNKSKEQNEREKETNKKKVMGGGKKEKKNW